MNGRNQILEKVVIASNIEKAEADWVLLRINNDNAILCASENTKEIKSDKNRKLKSRFLKRDNFIKFLKFLSKNAISNEEMAFFYLQQAEAVTPVCTS